jgi:hypothetical protein
MGEGSASAELLISEFNARSVAINPAFDRKQEDQMQQRATIRFWIVKPSVKIGLESGPI